MVGEKVGSEISSSITGSVSSTIPDKVLGFVNPLKDAALNAASKAGNAASSQITSMATSIGSSVGGNVGKIAGNVSGALGGYKIGETIIDKAITNDESKITDYAIMLVNKDNNILWLSGNKHDAITNNPNEAIVIHKGEDGINSSKDLKDKIINEKLIDVLDGYKIQIVGINEDGISKIMTEGVVSTALKTIGKVAGKVITKASPKIAKVAKNPALRKAINVGSKKLIRMKFFRSFIKTMTKSKFYKVLSNKKFIKTIVSSGKLAFYADDILLAIDMIKDYTKGNYKDISGESAAAAGASLYYIISPNEVTTGDNELDEEIVKEGLKSIKADLQHYKEWKDSKHHLVILKDKELIKDSVISEENSLFFRSYFNVILESAGSNEDKINKIEKVDKKFADDLKESLKTNGAIKISEEDTKKVSNLISKDDKAMSTIKSSNSKISKDSVNKILEKEEEIKSISDEIFSKETLMSLIPFSTSPKPIDIVNFFNCMNAYVRGEYDFDDNDRSELISIGVDVGITTISLACGGLAAFATFGVSMILAILSVSATLGYLLDSMTRIGRNYVKRMSEGTEKMTGVVEVMA